MQQLVTDFEQANLKIRKEVEDLRDYSTQLMVKAQKYEEAARAFEEKIQFHQQQIEILMEDSANSRCIAEILKRESKKIRDKAKNLLDIEIGDFNEKARDFNE